MQKYKNIMILLIFFIITFCVGIKGFDLNRSGPIQQGYGYIGPACAVFNKTLFLHGVSKRKLSDSELQVFQTYQDDLSKFQDSTSFDSFETQLPIIPEFCGGFDDAIEVVLDSCIIRNDHVYVDDLLIRPLSNFEKQKVQLIKMRRIYGNDMKRKKNRRRRRVRSLTANRSNRPHRDFGDMIHKFLNINSTVTSRFLPVVSQSPLFAMEGPWKHILSVGNKKPIVEMLNSKTGNDQLKIPKSIIDITKIDGFHRNIFTTTLTPNKIEKIPKKNISAKTFKILSTKKMTSTTTTTTTTTTTKTTTTTPIPVTTTAVREISLETNRVESSTRSTSPRTWTNEIVKTVVDPIVLQIIAKALENNELIDEDELRLIESPKKQTQTTLLPFRFIVPSMPISQPSSSFKKIAQISGPAHNHLFMPHQSFTSLISTDPKYLKPSPMSHKLPNEICRVHLNSNPY